MTNLDQEDRDYFDRHFKSLYDELKCKVDKEDRASTCPHNNRIAKVEVHTSWLRWGVTTIVGVLIASAIALVAYGGA